jgi:saccharopine dehydrogenase (NAD+, L-lysine forming)
MNKTIGIRHEDKYVMERRVAITPSHLKKLTEQGLKFQVQSSPKRIFSDAEFEEAGAEIVTDLPKASVIFGVKEMPADFFETDKTYVFFSHVIKGQAYNMPMLKAMMQKKCNLIDYEKIENEENKRLIFFGKYAGLAGMINSLWSLGQRLQQQGVDTPFLGIRQAYTYNSLEEAKAAVAEAGAAIASDGLPAHLSPMVIGFTGYGNVSVGAQEIANLLPSMEITPDQLLYLDEHKAARNVIYKVVFKEKDLSEPLEPNTDFDLQHYYQYPEAYKNQFEKYIPKLTVLMNCMYWDDRYPRIVTKDYLSMLYRQGEPKLKVIGDVTCDPDGSIECTHKGTEIEDPVFVYNPFERKPIMGFEGEGLLVMAVDILPSELPREASMTFSNALFPFVKAITEADFEKNFEELPLPSAIKKALILHKGELTPDYKYIEKYL